ncbi:saccharopine dehydrogenase NADP-binding domain-containing protein [Streptomyces europaeiscabiei]|uniref:saccharopine dehydrogenase family protein n=2 Tax=Streptomyces europaeiscabiei TaxID=146819 RepID=UPI0029B5286F|nr:saccharopine dehydrogenase family protein [Streptomyces europaeiscabiei]MDX2763851.1 saccharopine dehydrogenase NADP-binding domain-containing protein [Streptomyces europaeiscabiei]MDX3665371.1 saccharopine dehydrogenase NADP-binding domain-containing protein [Streptomyces europaeiscabiei]MDX3707442.1 saccharopine dehydrogenase NADP-binding domain-containing protein [Streptomyces europaeiscabiei]
MTEMVPASGTVHWVGAGLSTGSGLAALCDTAARVRLWHRTEERAGQALAALGLAGRAEPRAYTLPALVAELAPGDIVVSMLPAPDHGPLLQACVGARAHFACSSYVSDAILEQVPAASAAGVTVLTEAGLDPGIDHLFAHSLIARATAAIGPRTAASYSLTSYCGGVPAVPNDFRYRFSWAPAGVLNALRSPARYIEDGAETTADRPWTATRPHVVDGETFEAYPNRDSVPFVGQYGLPPAWKPQTFVRGTLRLDGWLTAWAPVFAELEDGDDRRIAALARELAARHPTTDTDRDRVVLAVGLDVHAGSGERWSGRYLLDAVGTEEESAMARLVSRPLALGVGHILDGSLPVGLSRAAETGGRSETWLAELARAGVEFGLRTD